MGGRMRVQWLRILGLALAFGVAAAPASAQEETFGSEGVILQSAEGDYRLQIGVLVQADGQFALSDSSQQVVNTFSFGRLRPYLRGRFSKRFEFYFNPDFAGGNLVVQDAYVDTIFAPAFRLCVGKAKTPFGLERLHSAYNLLIFICVLQ